MTEKPRPLKPLAPTRKGALTRAKLIESGRKAFATYGYDRTRIADVVRLADISHGNFYRHFTDKDDLLHAVLEELHTELRRPSPLKQPGTSLYAEMIHRNTSFFRTYAIHRDLLRVAREAAAKPPPNPFLQIWLDMRQPYIEHNLRWMYRLQEQALIDATVNVGLMADALGAMVEQFAYVHIALPEKPPTATELDNMGQICGLIWHRSIFGSTDTALQKQPKSENTS